MNNVHMMDLKQRLNNCYVSPYSKAKASLSALIAHVQGQRPVLRIAEPETWLVEYVFNEIQHYSREQSIEILQAWLGYLECNEPVFTKSYGLQVMQPLPYFEWKDQNQLWASSDFLGQDVVIYWLREEDLVHGLEWLEKLKTICQEKKYALLLIVEQNIEYRLDNSTPFAFIDPEDLERLKFTAQQKSLKSVFLQTDKSTILVSPQGIVNFIGKFDLAKLCEYLLTI